MLIVTSSSKEPSIMTVILCCDSYRLYCCSAVVGHKKCLVSDQVIKACVQLFLCPFCWVWNVITVFQICNCFNLFNCARPICEFIITESCCAAKLYTQVVEYFTQSKRCMQNTVWNTFWLSFVKFWEGIHKYYIFIMLVMRP